MIQRWCNFLTFWFYVYHFHRTEPPTRLHPDLHGQANQLGQRV